MTLPIHAVLDDLRAALSAGPNAVLVAPPGAGKSTVVPLELLGALPGSATQKIIVLEPRRLAARAVARRMAATLGEKVGETVGYRVRMDSAVSARTRIEVVTEGIFTRQILNDPELNGISAVLFDEFHERSLNTDLGLALALDAQALRPDLRILVMSATIDGARVAHLMDDAPVIASEGRMFPVETRHIDPEPRAPLAETVARAIQTGLRAEQGSILVFLPGAGEIRQVERRLAETVTDPAVRVAPLYGALDGTAQDAAISPAPPGTRKIVLATAIAETSLTIEGVRVVIDSGFARKPVFDPATGLSHLETVRVSQAAADQRRGRAGRTQPGVCYRLWAEGQTRALNPYDTPEILSADLSGLALDLAQWDARPNSLRWLDTPPKGAWAEAERLLATLGAVDAAGRITPHGRDLAKRGLDPRLGHMLLTAPDPVQAAQLAVLLQERGLGGDDVDLGHRLSQFQTGSGGRISAARGYADQLMRGLKQTGSEFPAQTLARAFPDRVAKSQGVAGQDTRFLLANGRAGLLPRTDAMSKAAWLVVADMQGRAGAARITSAIALIEAEFIAVLGSRIVNEEGLGFDPASASLKARRVKRYGAIILSEAPQPMPKGADLAAVWITAVRQYGLEILPLDTVANLRARAAFAGVCDLSDAALIETLEDWLPACGLGMKAAELDLHQGLWALIGYERQKTLNQLAPAHFTAPTGTEVPIDYTAEGGPRMAVRVQELFGLGTHPTVGQGVALTIELLSPARRPVQLTKDLSGFWRGSYAAVRIEMKGRYPRHPWPEDPLSAPPTTRVKPKG